MNINIKKTSKAVREFLWHIGMRSNSSREEIEKDISEVLEKHFGYQFWDTETDTEQNDKR